VDEFVLSVGYESIQDVELYVCQGELFVLGWKTWTAVNFAVM
jgi:hypothetical protein